MSDKSPSPAPLMELDVTPPKGYPKLPKWSSNLKYKLKNPSLIDEFENPFQISSDLSDTEDSNIDFSKLKHLAGLLPRSAPAPCGAEEIIVISKSSSKSQGNSSGRRGLADRILPIKYKIMNESCESSDSTTTTPSSENSLSFVEKYLKVKRRKALLLQKLNEDSNASMELSVKCEDPELLNETDFFLEENVIKKENEFASDFLEAKSNTVKETSFLFNGKSKSSPENSKSNNTKHTNQCPSSPKKNKHISKNCALNSLTKQMKECYI